MVADEAGFSGADDVGQLVEARLSDALDALEMGEEGLLGGGTDPFDAAELADDSALAAAVAVVGDAEAVGLVAAYFSFNPPPSKNANVYAGGIEFRL